MLVEMLTHYPLQEYRWVSVLIIKIYYISMKKVYKRVYMQLTVETFLVKTNTLQYDFDQTFYS